MKKKIVFVLMLMGMSMTSTWAFNPFQALWNLLFGHSRSTVQVVEPTPVPIPRLSALEEEPATPVASEPAPVENNGLPTNLQFVTLECDNALNLRAQADKESTRIDDLNCKSSNGEARKVIILGKEGDFYKIFFNNQVGYISADYTSEPKPIEQINEQTEPVDKTAESLPGKLNCVTRLNRRGGPSTRYRILGQIPCRSNGEGTEIKVLGRDKDSGWYIVEYNGQKAWVSNRYVDVDETNQELRQVVDGVNQDLNAIHDDAVLSTGGCLTTPALPTDSSDCVPLSSSFYNSPESGQNIASLIRQAESSGGTNGKKQKFFELFVPIALKIQKETGWPASVTLAQMALETAWGTSGVLRRNNNFGGHSCFSYAANTSRPLRNSGLAAAASRNENLLAGDYKSNSGNSRISVNCTYRRPAREGGYYLTFPSVMDAAFLYADNVLENDAYSESQDHVKAAQAQGRQADPNVVINGLRRYAADSDYRDNLKITMRANNLRKYDSMVSCD